MSAITISRRVFTLTAIPFAVGIVAAERATALQATPGQTTPAQQSAVSPATAIGLTHGSEAIHQEIVFTATRKRVYAALTQSSQFDAMTRLSDAEVLLKATGAKPTFIDDSTGGSFTLFGGYVTGRNLEMADDQLLVQAWRAASWPHGAFSVVKFDLVEQGASTRLIFDHRGFPDGEGTSLAEGWYSHYWKPLAKFLDHS